MGLIVRLISYIIAGGGGYLALTIRDYLEDTYADSVWLIFLNSLTLGAIWVFWEFAQVTREIYDEHAKS